MKRIVVILLAIVCGVAFSNGFAKKPTKRQKIEEQAIQDSLALVEQNRERELDLMKKELEALEEELRVTKERRSANQKGKPLEIEEEEILLPCQEEAKSNDEYFGAFGMSENEMSANYAISRATLDAQKNLARMVGEDIDSNLIEMVCRQLARESDGTWAVFVAIRYPKNKR